MYLATRISIVSCIVTIGLAVIISAQLSAQVPTPRGCTSDDSWCTGDGDSGGSSGGRSNNCDSDCQQRRQEAAEQNERYREWKRQHDAEETARKQQNKEVKANNKIIEKANKIAVKAYTFLQKEECAKAVALYDQALTLTDFSPWKQNRAFCLERMGNLAQAVLGFRQVFNDPTTDPEERRRVTLAITFIQQELDDAAREQTLAVQKAAQERIVAAQRERIAADNIQQETQNFAQSLHAAPSSGGLDFSDGESRNNSDKSSGLTFTASDSAAVGSPTQPSQGARTCTFGTTCNPANPNQTNRSVPTPGPDTKAGDQLVSAAETAKKHPDDLTTNYDIGGALSVGSINVPRPAGQTPGAVELVRHIKDRAQKDGEIQQSMAYYRKLDGEKINTQLKLAAVQQQIKSGSGDAQSLNAQKATLSNDLKRCDADQAKTQAQIKERLVKIGLPWNEDPPPATSATAKP